VSDQKIRTSVQDRVAVITLADPATLNAASLDLVAEASAALDAFAAEDSGVRCVILTGEGRGFCSGANLAGRDPAAIAKPSKTLDEVYSPFLQKLRDYPIPIVTAVNGVAAGIGCSLALMGDLVVAAESADFLQAFRRIGLVPDGGATYLLSRLIGRARAMELMLLGEPLPAKTALEWGLINRCVPDVQLMATAGALAKALADGPRALGHIRKLAWDGLDASWGEQLSAESAAQDMAVASEDAREGVAAFLQKRPAKFTGR
jgi:2-(1,2-epoxy-1,2-dihydrophenyl)acetyl-CoA isomerase